MNESRHTYGSVCEAIFIRVDDDDETYDDKTCDDETYDRETYRR